MSWFFFLGLHPKSILCMKHKPLYINFLSLCANKHSTVTQMQCVSWNKPLFQRRLWNWLGGKNCYKMNQRQTMCPLSQDIVTGLLLNKSNIINRNKIPIYFTISCLICWLHCLGKKIKLVLHCWSCWEAHTVNYSLPSCKAFAEPHSSTCALKP